MLLAGVSIELKLNCVDCE